MRTVAHAHCSSCTLSVQEMEFSDDEEEQAHKRKLKSDRKCCGLSRPAHRLLTRLAAGGPLAVLKMRLRLKEGAVKVKVARAARGNRKEVEARCLSLVWIIRVMRVG
jgi:hypothetical protein